MEQNTTYSTDVTYFLTILTVRYAITNATLTGANNLPCGKKCCTFEVLLFLLLFVETKSKKYKPLFMFRIPPARRRGDVFLCEV